MVDRLNTGATENTAPLGTNPHDKAMIDAVDKANQPPVQENFETPQARPEWLPEKFNSPAEMAKAYAELESKLGAKPTETPAEQTPDTAKVEQQLEAKGLDLRDFSKEFAEKGALSQESLDKLAKAGYPKEVVDQYIAGQQALATQTENAILANVGGREGYDQMAEWAKTAMGEEELAAYNNIMDSGNTDAMKFAVNSLKQRYEAAVGKDPKLLQGKSVASVEAFESSAQVTQAMRDPRYKADPAYRAQVQAKLARSNVF